MLKVVFH